MGKGIFIAESMASTDLVSLLRSAISKKEMENGSVINLGALVNLEDDLYEAAVVTDKKEVYLVDGVELQADERQRMGLDDFVNPADKAYRVRKPLSGDRFSVSVDVLDGAVAKDDILEANAGNKLVKVASATDGATSFKVVEEWVFGARLVNMVRLVTL